MAHVAVQTHDPECFERLPGLWIEVDHRDLRRERRIALQQLMQQRARLTMEAEEHDLSAVSRDWIIPRPVVAQS